MSSGFYAFWLDQGCSETATMLFRAAGYKILLLRPNWCNYLLNTLRASVGTIPEARHNWRTLNNRPVFTIIKRRLAPYQWPVLPKDIYVVCSPHPRTRRNSSQAQLHKLNISCNMEMLHLKTGECMEGGGNCSNAPQPQLGLPALHGADEPSSPPTLLAALAQLLQDAHGVTSLSAAFCR